jgi:hypothetical protein
MRHTSCGDVDSVPTALQFGVKVVKLGDTSVTAEPGLDLRERKLANGGSGLRGFLLGQNVVHVNDRGCLIEIEENVANWGPKARNERGGQS